MTYIETKMEPTIYERRFPKGQLMTLINTMYAHKPITKNPLNFSYGVVAPRLPCQQVA